MIYTIYFPQPKFVIKGRRTLSLCRFSRNSQSRNELW